MHGVCRLGLYVWMLGENSREFFEGCIERSRDVFDVRTGRIDFDRELRPIPSQARWARGSKRQFDLHGLLHDKLLSQRRQWLSYQSILVLSTLLLRVW